MRALVLGLALILTACGGPSQRSEITNDSPAQFPAGIEAEVMNQIRNGKALSAVSADTSGPQSLSQPSLATPPGNPIPPNTEPGNPSALSYLSYRYNYTFALPAKAVKPTMEDHMKICAAAGPTVCQVLRSYNNVQSETNIRAFLSLRAERTWLETYAADVQSSVEAAKGDIRESNVSTEDLTRQILDTDARLKAQITLRDRLQNLLETRNAELKDLLALERELARVQGQIESATTTLNVLRKRVSMSVVDINYNSQSVAVSRSALLPIGRSLKGFVSTLAYGLSNVIDFFAVILPWFLLVILPGLWLLRRFWRRRKTL